MVLADLGDNPGGGTAADGTSILWGLMDLGAEGAVVSTIRDPDVVELAFEAGEGAEIETMLGGKTDERHGYPIPIKATVNRLSNGDFVYDGPMDRGVHDTLGRTAVLGVQGRYGHVVDGDRVRTARSVTRYRDPSFAGNRAVGVQNHCAQIGGAFPGCVHANCLTNPRSRHTGIDLAGLHPISLRAVAAADLAHGRYLGSETERSSPVETFNLYMDELSSDLNGDADRFVEVQFRIVPGSATRVIRKSMRFWPVSTSSI